MEKEREKLRRQLGRDTGETPKPGLIFRLIFTNQRSAEIPSENLISFRLMAASAALYVYRAPPIQLESVEAAHSRRTMRRRV
ncbi:hypothetical protein RI054_03g18420 [Pseudoscourfieldia marina]